MPTKINHLSMLPILVGCCIAFLYVYFVDGVRGTDQHWYLADTESLLVSKEETTNTVFPGMVLRQQDPNPITHFIHNGPLLTVNAALAEYIGSFAAWKYSNLFFYLAAAAFTWFTTRALCGARYACFAATLYLVVPSHIWLLGNFLQETFFSFITAALLFFVVTGQRSNLAIWCIPSLFFVGALVHPMYIILGLVFSFACLISRINWKLSLACLGAVFLAKTNKVVWYPSSFQPDFLSIIKSSVPGVSNSIWQLSDILPELTVDLMWLKFLNAMELQFISLHLAPMYFVTNLGLIAFFYVCIKDRGNRLRFLYIAGLCALLYGALIILMQNQFRYQLLIAPVVVVMIALAYTQIDGSKLLRYSALAMIAGFFCLDVVMLKKISADNAKELQILEFLSAEISTSSDEDRVAIIASDIAEQIRFVTLLSPRKTLMVDSDLLSNAKIHEVLDIFSPDIVFTDTKNSYIVAERYELVKNIVPPSGSILSFYINE